ncbi:MAG: electron transfer flavoprotein subunit beta, partial [Promethearchaeota archaeon]
MRFIVCVKQVPDTTEVKIDPETNTLIREGVPSILNPFDQFALEEAIKIKKEGDEIIVISMGPTQAKKALLKCLALGADKAILLSDKVFAGADTWATSYTLVQSIKKIGDYNMIFCGLQAIDGDTAQVGPEIAAQLGIPQITHV